MPARSCLIQKSCGWRQTFFVLQFCICAIVLVSRGVGLAGCRALSYAIVSHCEWVHAMGSRRAHVVLPQELLEEIDATVGTRGRSAFLVDTARSELRRRRLMSFLQSAEPAWRDADHPELTGGTKAWVHSLRREERDQSVRQRPKASKTK